MFGEAYLISSSVSAAGAGVLSTPDAVPGQKSASAPIFHGPAKTGHKLTDLAVGALDNLKGEQMVTFDLRGRSNICDFMVIASGRSNTHVGALADTLSKNLKKMGLKFSASLALNSVIGLFSTLIMSWFIFSDLRFALFTSWKKCGIQVFRWLNRTRLIAHRCSRPDKGLGIEVDNSRRWQIVEGRRGSLSLPLSRSNAASKTKNT
mgnify:CR=1 FL=1